MKKALFADSGQVEKFIHFCFYVLKVNISPEDVTMAQPTDHPKTVLYVLRAYMKKKTRTSAKLWSYQMPKLINKMGAVACE